MINRLAEYDTPISRRDSASDAAPSGKRPFITGNDIQGFVQPVENLIVRYPGAALASALFVGVLVAWWIKRK